MYITDTETGITRLYGTARHDSLVKSDDGRCLHYYNLQCGEGSRYGMFLFTDDQGRPPKDNFELLKYGAEDYFNIGGFGEIHMSQIEEIKTEVKERLKEPACYVANYDMYEWFLDAIDKHIGKGQDV